MNKNYLIFVLCMQLFGCDSIQSNDSKEKIIGGFIAPSNKNEKGVYSSTIGLVSEHVKSCTGSKIGSNTFITAGHCLVGAEEGEYITVYSSNARKFQAQLSNIRIHPTYVQQSLFSTNSDVGVFELVFFSREEQSIFNGFVDTVKVTYTNPLIGTPILIAGFGCELKTVLSVTKCDKYPNFDYMKYANNKIIEDNAFLNSTDFRYFQLDGSSNKADANGFVSDGDSGGPALTSDGLLMGVTHAAKSILGGPSTVDGQDAFLLYTEHTWLGFEDVRSWLDAAMKNDSTQPKFYSGPKVIDIKYVNGDLYRGLVGNGFRNGTGTMGFADGKVYSGSWVNDVRKGYGEQSWPEGSKYVSYKGNWENDLPNGYGVIVFAVKQTYAGEFVNAKLTGKGQLTYANGDVRVGTFANSKREGEFILTTSDGKRYRETFVNDVRSSIEQI